MMKVLSTCLALLLSPAMGYQPSSNSYGNTVGRRDCVNGLVGAAAGICLGFLPPQKAQAVISKEICASGQGSGCDDLAEGNEYIKSLQQKSASNADMYAREARNAYYQKNYPDVFAVDGKSMVKKSDGTFMIVDDRELNQLKKDNKIGVEIPKAMKGRVVDLTQKPVMILKE